MNAKQCPVIVFNLLLIQAMPRKAQRLRRKRSRSAPSVLQSPAKRPRRKQWSKEQMEAALKAAKCGSGVNRAAIDHGIPPTTLKDRLRGRTENSGMPRYLNTEEENKLVNFLMQCSSVGYGKIRRGVMKIPEKVAKEKTY